MTVHCYICRKKFSPEPAAVKAFIESSRAYDPTDWACPDCRAYSGHPIEKTFRIIGHTVTADTINNYCLTRCERWSSAGCKDIYACGHNPQPIRWQGYARTIAEAYQRFINEHAGQGYVVVSAGIIEITPEIEMQENGAAALFELEAA